VTTASSSPALRVLSLGAGVQSTSLLLLAAEGGLPALDAAIFADTGWEPRAVYEHLDRLEREVARPAGIPILRVSSGNIRDDALEAEAELELGEPDGCSPWSCRSGAPVQDDFDITA
jgi:3'-phosphoadenosine 5'-phosphosulfate sulfotransferase (PAPS reductase)/FAD synthetase